MHWPKRGSRIHSQRQRNNLAPPAPGLPAVELETQNTFLEDMNAISPPAASPADPHRSAQKTATTVDTTGLLHEEPLLFEYPRSDALGVALRTLDVPLRSAEELLPRAALREDALADLPTLSEFEVLRHYTRLSRLNTSIDAAMYPLGSCTMKYNPRINEVAVRQPGLAQAHPLLPVELVQGVLEAMHQLQQMLLEITGFAAASLQPCGGAQGELTGVLLIRACQEQRGERRRWMLVPDSAHGTNPASARMARYEVRELPSTAEGIIDPAELARAMNSDTAGLMLTNPNTLGIFEPQILRIAEIVHAAGGHIYCDGANMNAQVGIARPGCYGMDVMHLNLHKTFSTPHGGGGPGAGPCFCSEELAPFLPVPRIVQGPNGYEIIEDAPQSIGRIASFYGNCAVLLRALSYLFAMGNEGLQEMTRVAVLNANYLRHRLGACLPVATSLPTLHEVVFSGEKLSEDYGINTMDLAKRLLDYGFHPPTVYFPLTVQSALMVEPTESEPLAELDRFVAAVESILREAIADPEYVRAAPHLMPRHRLDEARAARNPILRWHAASE